MNDRILKEYETATRSAVAIDLSARGKIEVAGKDRVSFLHRMLTNEIKSLAPGQGCFACLLNAQAKILADMHVWITESSVVLGVEPGLAEKTISSLQKFVVTDDVTLTDKTNELCGFAVIGPQNEMIVQALTGFEEYPAADFSHRPAKIWGVDAYVMCLPIFRKKSWYVASKTENKATLQKVLEEAGAPLIGAETAEILRIESGSPCYGTDVTENILLPEVKMWESRAVSFTKGCYPGQEIVARIDSRGKFAKQFAQIEAEGDEIPKPNDPVQKDDREIGRITSAAFSPKLSKPLALGFIARDFLTPGVSFEILSGGKKIPAKLV